MKNFIGALLLVVFFGSIQVKAQTLESPGLPQNEVKLNIFNTIINGSLELGYEHFLDQNQSQGCNLAVQIYCFILTLCIKAHQIS